MLAPTLECQGVVCELHVDVLFDTPRQLGHEIEGIVGLVESRPVAPRRPPTRGPLSCRCGRRVREPVV